MTGWTHSSSILNSLSSTDLSGQHRSRTLAAAQLIPFAGGKATRMHHPRMGDTSSQRYHISRPNSRQSCRAPTPSLLSVDDTEAFPSLGLAAKYSKKHHGKREHGHNYDNKENVSSSLETSFAYQPHLRRIRCRKGS